MAGLLFDRSNELLQDIVYEKVGNHRTFLHMKSFFEDSWYNFIVPEVKASGLDWEKVEGVVGKEKLQGVSMSYYVHDELLGGYKEKLGSAFGSDVYIYKELKEKFDVNPDLEFVEVEDKNLDSFIAIAKECFPDWENNEKYARHFVKLAKGGGEKICKNFLLRFKGEMAAIGCIVISKGLNLSYLHNMGTVKKHRRRGLFSEFSKFLANQSLLNGASEVYALVEEGGGSFNGFRKLGFEGKEKYSLFETGV